MTIIKISKFYFGILMFAIQARRHSSVTGGGGGGGGGGAYTIFGRAQKLCSLEIESEDQKKKVFTAESAKNRFLLTNFGVMTSILGVSGLELHSSGTKSVTFFGAQSLLWGHNPRFGGAKAVI